MLAASRQVRNYGKAAAGSWVSRLLENANEKMNHEQRFQALGSAAWYTCTQADRESGRKRGGGGKEAGREGETDGQRERERPCLI